MESVELMMHQNGEDLDRIAFQIQISKLMDMKFEPLRSELSRLAADTPHLCLKVTAEMLNRLRKFPESFAGDRRKALFYYTSRAVKNLEKMEVAEPAQELELDRAV